MKSDQFFLSNEMDVRPPPAKKRKQYAGVYQADWGRMFEGMIAPSKLGEHYAWCVVQETLRSTCFKRAEIDTPDSVMTAEVMFSYFVAEHNLPAAIADHLFRCRTQPPCCHCRPLISWLNTTSLLPLPTTYFVAEHNLPAAIADHFTNLAPRLSPDSEVAKKFRCKRTKTAQIVKECLAPKATKPVIESQKRYILLRA